jgi:sodium transport system permease protein
MNAGALRMALVVAAKELADSLRDRRTLAMTLFASIISGPLVLVLMFTTINQQIDKAEQLKLPVIAAERAPALAAFLDRQQVELVEAPADYRDKLRSGEFDVVLEIAADFGETAARGDEATVTLHYDDSRKQAASSIRRVERLLRAYGRNWGDARLQLRGVSASVAHPLAVDADNLATPQQAGSAILFMIGFYGLFATAVGGLATALDLTAGERERGSLEPLLTVPVPAWALAAGKWLAVSVIALSVSLLTVVGFYLTLRYAPLPKIGVPFLFGIRECLRVLATLCPLGLMYAALLSVFALRGRSYKEGQTNTGLVIFVVSLLPLIQTMTQQGKQPAWLVWVPVVGHNAVIEKVLRGEVVGALDWLAIAALPALVTVIAVWMFGRMLSREAVAASR